MKFLLFTISLLFISFGLGVNKNSLVEIFPAHFPEPTYDFEKNPLNQETITLGRTLFYDPLLSKDNSISCASCHSPYNAFAHTDHELSHGINDQTGTRNAPGLFNLAWQSSFMWDGAVNHLDVQALAPLTSQSEMGEDLISVINKLQNSPIYPELFTKAFKDSMVTGEHLLKALSQFQLTLISANSKYDKVLREEETYTPQELNGKRLFEKNCNTCHVQPTFSNHEFKRNGLELDFTLNDYGKFNHTKLAKDSFLFKVPSLRNLSYTFPYMHDGRFSSIREVINHYTDGLNDKTSSSQELKEPIRLTSDEKTDLVAFLLTLNDEEFVFNKKHHYPLEILRIN